MSSWLRSSFFLVAILFSAGCLAQDSVQITGERTPVDKSYRKMVRGMDLFERLHAMAPGASLRYRLVPRKSYTDLENVAVDVVGDGFARPVAMAPDHSFILNKDPKAWNADALVRANRGAGSMTWRAQVRTPGLPAGTRRLGDLRLECLVGTEADLISHYPSFIERLADLFQTPQSFCGRRDAPYLFFADKPIFGVTLIAGERRQTLSVMQLYAGLARGKTPKGDLKYCDCEALLDRAYYAPLGDKSWPDDTLVQLEFMDSPPARDALDETLVGGTKADVTAAFGKPIVLGFASGYEVWAYPGPAETMVLFDASGTVVKARLDQ